MHAHISAPFYVVPSLLEKREGGGGVLDGSRSAVDREFWPEHEYFPNCIIIVKSTLNHTKSCKSIMAISQRIEDMSIRQRAKPFSCHILRGPRS